MPYDASGGVYGARRVLGDLREAGEVCGKHRVEEIMHAQKIKANLDVIEQVAACFLATAVDAASHSLLLQASEERLRHGVILAIATPAHAGLQAMFATESTPVVAAVLHPLVGVDRQRRHGHLSPSNHLSEWDLGAILEANALRPGFCDFLADGVRFSQFCGIVGLQSRSLEILPKVGGHDHPDACRGVLLRCLQDAGWRPIA